MHNRRRRVWLAFVCLAAVALAGLRFDLSSEQSRVDALARTDQRARSTAASASNALRSAHEHQLSVSEDAARARSELQGARQLLKSSGLDLTQLNATVDSTGTYLTSLRAMQSQTEQALDELTRTLPVAKQCIDSGLQSLSLASSGQGPASNDTTCSSIGAQTFGLTAGTAP